MNHTRSQRFLLRSMNPGACVTFLFLLFCFPIVLNCVEPRDYAIEVSAVSNPASSTVALHWESKSDTSHYSVSRKAIKDGKYIWKLLADHLSATDYTDTVFQPEYPIIEYQIKCQIDSAEFAYGYIAAATQTVDHTTPQTLLLFVDDMVYREMKEKVTEYKNLFIADGYKTIMYPAPRSEIFNAGNVRYTKSIIDQERKKHHIDYIVIFGHVAVPYSGYDAADGHPNHIGAWPCDAYYASEYKGWSDSVVTAKSATDPRNHNLPEDGKFDQLFSYDSIKTVIGRIDFYNLPAFGKTELELYSEYIDKVRDYKSGKLIFRNRGLITDKFHVSYTEKQATEAWINYLSLFGSSEIDTAEFVPSLCDSSYLMAYACNSGGYTSILNTVSTEDFAKYDLKAAITCFMGSYLGDWDSENNLLRGAIASKSTLNSYFGGRPFWFFHRLALGETTGEAYETAINNMATFYSATHIYGFKMLHISLLGDPTINIYPISPVKSVTQTNLPDRVELTWKLPENTSNLVNLYRAVHIDSTFERINSHPLSPAEMPYCDFSGNDSCVYMVRTLPQDSLIYTKFGNIYREGIGIFSDKSAKVAPEPDNEIEIFPNPASTYIRINGWNESADIFDSMGRKVLSKATQPIGITQLSNGLYFAKIGDKVKSFVVFR